MTQGIVRRYHPEPKRGGWPSLMKASPQDNSNDGGQMKLRHGRLTPPPAVAGEAEAAEA